MNTSLLTMKPEQKTSVDQTAGDYRVRIWTDGRITIDRHGQPWQTDGVPENANVILALAHEVEGARAEIAELRAIFPRVLERLGSGACAPDCSVEFLRHIPDEVGGIVSKLRAELEDAKAEIDRLTGMAEEEVAKRAAREAEYLRGAKMLAENGSEWARRAETAAAQVAALVAAGDALYSSANRNGVECDEEFAAWDAAKSGTRAETWPLNDGDEVLHAMANGTAPDTRDALIHLIAELRAVTSQCVGGPTLELVRKLIVKYDPESSGSIGPAPASKPTAEVPDPRDAALRNADEAIGSAIGVLNAIRGESQHCDSCHAFERATDWMNEWHGGDRVRVPIAAALSATPASAGAELAELRADKARLDTRCIRITFAPDEWGHTSCIHQDIDLRAAIDAAREANK